jgi:hypothetical protein
MFEKKPEAFIAITPQFILRKFHDVAAVQNNGPGVRRFEQSESVQEEIAPGRIGADKLAEGRWRERERNPVKRGGLAFIPVCSLAAEFPARENRIHPRK